MSTDDSRFSPLPAPDRLRLVQSFLNTRRIETDRDDLKSPRALAAWLAREDLAPADTELDEAAWRQALQARDGLRALLRRNAGAALAAADVERLNRVFGEVRAGLRFAADGSLGLVTSGTGWEGALSRILRLIFEEMRAGRWQRLKTCRNEECQLTFYDSSRNRSGKWCNVRRCGNRINARAYRKREPAWKAGRPTHKWW